MSKIVLNLHFLQEQFGITNKNENEKKKLKIWLTFDVYVAGKVEGEVKWGRGLLGSASDVRKIKKLREKVKPVTGCTTASRAQILMFIS